MIQLENIGKVYSSPAGPRAVLQGVSLTIEAGEFVAIMGPSGAGKTTLMSIIGCLSRPTSGRLWLDGSDTSRLDDVGISRLRNQKIGFVFQMFHLLRRLTAADNVALPLLYAAHYPSDARERAAALLTRVGLGEHMKAVVSVLSGGQQQRVAIARALITGPPVILADEPTGNLDSASGGEVLDLFRELNEEGRTIVIITHDPAVARSARRIVTISDGRIADDSRLG